MLEGPLAENAEMKSLMRAELSWFCGAESENASSCAIGRLFETRRLEKEERTALNGLSDMRIEDGTWPWFPGGCRNDFMTFTIVSGFGRLRQLGVAPKMELALAALPSLDAWVTERYKTVLRGGRQGENQLTPMVALALYARSFFLNDCAIGSADRDVFAFFTGQAKRYGLKMERPQQAHLALALKRWGDAAAAASLLKAVRDTAVTDEEKGMYWRDERPSASGAHTPRLRRGR